MNPHALTLGPNRFGKDPLPPDEVIDALRISAASLKSLRSIDATLKGIRAIARYFLALSLISIAITVLYVVMHV